MFVISTDDFANAVSVSLKAFSVSGSIVPDRSLVAPNAGGASLWSSRQGSTSSSSTSFIRLS